MWLRSLRRSSPRGTRDNSYQPPCSLPEMTPRKKTRQISVGKVLVGGSAPIVVQSMPTTNPANVEATRKEVTRMKLAGCELVRVAVPDQEAISGLRELVCESPLPIIADVHFDHRLALLAL